jgi:hypothetical protein
MTYWLVQVHAASVAVARAASQLAGCEFHAPQKRLRLINVYAISFMP